jgi:hypothetical protein
MRNKVLISMLILALLLTPTLMVSAEGMSMEVVASGLNNPRGLAFGFDGALYVAEAGVGGEGPCITSPEGGEACYGPSGSITRINLAEGSQSVFAGGFPSLAEGGFGATGPTDITFNGPVAYVIVGLGADPAARAELGDAGSGFGQLVQLTRKGKWKFAKDVSAYESKANPDGGAIDSNPYSVLAIGGKAYVADAGGNDLVMVPGKGKIKTIAVFPDRLVEFPPGSGEMMPMQAVPTSVVRGPDGAFYVGQLTGFPFPVGGANVFRIVPGSEPEVFADGFTNIIDIAFGQDGSLYVLEIVANGLLSADPADPTSLTGALIKVDPDGTRTTIASEGLIAPGGLAIGPDGAIYVSNYSIFPGMGEVVKITP